MSTARWLIVFLIALGISIPAQLGMPNQAEAVELNLGGFPSFMRTRARYIQNGTFQNALSDAQAQAIGFESADDEIFLVDTTLRLTPQLVLSDSVTIRAQVDVLRNNIWGGLTSNVFGSRGGDNAVLGELTADDSFRGSILVGPNAVDLGGDEQNFFRVRMLHADIVLPNNLGFVRIGRQPFDWGLGIWANGGWDPNSDLGFLPERFLWLKSWPIGSGTVTQVLVSDLVASGSSIHNGQGKAFDIIAGATIYNNPNVNGINFTLGGFYFPFFQQDNVGATVPLTGAAFSSAVDVDRLGLYSGFIDFKTDTWRLAYEVDMQEGTLEAGAIDIDIDPQFEMVGRFELYPSWPVKVIGIEGGWSQGQDGNDTDVTGNLVPIHPSYNVDNLLYKHVIPTIYQREGSVQNSYYARAYATIKLLDHLSTSPQVLVAWNHETDTTIGDPSVGIGSAVVVNDVDDFLGIELENTLTWTVHPGVNVDLIGSLILAGDGLTDLLEAQAEVAAGGGVGSADDTIWAVQGRLQIFIDQFFN